MVLRRSRAPRTGTPADLLVVGLGNPGEEYARAPQRRRRSRRAARARHGAKLKKGKERARVDEVRIAGKRVALAIPLTYMNDSGESVGLLARRYGVEPEQVVIVHDELDLPVAALKIKSGGGLAGHNGLRSIKSHLHSDEFQRVRIGVGKPVSKERGADHVLNRFGKRGAEIDVTLEQAADAVEMIASEGIDPTMNRYNTYRDPDRGPIVTSLRNGRVRARPRPYRGWPSSSQSVKARRSSQAGTSGTATSVAAPLAGADERGTDAGVACGLDVAIGVRDEPGLGRIEGPRHPRQFDEQGAGLPARTPHLGGVRAHVEAIEGVTEPVIELVVDRVQRVERELAAPDDGLVGDDQQAVAGVTQRAGRFVRPWHDFEVLEAFDRVGSVDVEHSVTIEENYPVANLKHSSAPVERLFVNIQQAIDDHQVVMTALGAVIPEFTRASARIVQSLRAGGTVFWFGNGGSASQSQHFATELVGRYLVDRPGLASIALTTDGALLTAVANDGSFDDDLRPPARGAVPPR